MFSPHSPRSRSDNRDFGLLVLSGFPQGLAAGLSRPRGLIGIKHTNAPTTSQGRSDSLVIDLLLKLDQGQGALTSTLASY